LAAVRREKKERRKVKSTLEGEGADVFPRRGRGTQGPSLPREGGGMEE